MKEYIIKLTQTEAEALTYIAGSQCSITPIITTEMFNDLSKEVFVKNDIKYNRYVREISTLVFHGFII
jgi:hypothetical protein